MLTVVQSQLCRELFKERLYLPAFLGPATPRIHQVVPISAFRESWPERARDNGLILYTNLWPVTTSEEQVEVMFDTVRLNSVTVAVVGSLDNEDHLITYPRKSDVRFPARTVAYETVHPDLLWGRVMNSCFFESVSMAMFASLACDVTFRRILVTERSESDEIVQRIRREYDDAHDRYTGLGLEVHGYRSRGKVPYAELRSR